LVHEAWMRLVGSENPQFERLDLEHADIAIHANDETLLLVNDALDKPAAEDLQAG